MAASTRRRLALAGLQAPGAAQTACPPPWHWRHERRRAEREERYRDREERRPESRDQRPVDHGDERRGRREDRGERD